MKELIYSTTRNPPRLKGKLCAHCKQMTLFDDSLILNDHYDHYVCWDCLYHLYHACDWCGESRYLKNDRRINSLLRTMIDETERVCETCVTKKPYKVCGDCKQLYAEADCQYFSHLDKFVCFDCIKSNYVKCSFCGNCHKNNHLQQDNAGNYRCNACQEQIGKCSRCRMFHPRESMRVVEGISYCVGCFSSMFSICDFCEQHFNREEIFSYNDHVYCWDCGDARELPTFALMNKLIQEYHYRPLPRFRKLAGDDKLYMGFELEVENKKESVRNNEMVKMLFKILKNFCYYKRDGSIEYGFEIVSHPFTWRWFKKNRPMVVEALDLLRNQGFRSYEPCNCGIHIHISRDAFVGDSHLFKFLKFFYENHPFILKISQRDPSRSSGCSWGGREEYDDQKTLLHKTKDKYASSRYTAVNMNNDNTYEIRIFRGTLKPESFFKNIEFVKALFEFTLATGIREINPKSFGDYVSDYRKVYPNLYGFCVSKKMIK